MGRKKGDRATTQMRIYVEFAEAVRQAAGERGLTVAALCEVHLTRAVEEVHRRYVAEESEKLKKRQQGDLGEPSSTAN